MADADVCEPCPTGLSDLLAMMEDEEVDQVFDELDPGFFPALKTLTRSAKVNLKS